MHTKKWLLLLPTFGLLLLSCSSPQKQEEHHAHEEEEGKIILNKVQEEALGLRVNTLEKKEMDQTIMAMGNLQLAPTDKSKVLSYLGGYIKTIHVVEGNYVKKGKILATIENPKFINLQQEYIQAYNQWRYSEKAYQREKKLYEQKINASKDFQKTEAEYYSNLSDYKGLKIQLEMLGVQPSSIEKGNLQRTLKIIAPINGYVNTIAINLGTFVDEQTELFTISNTQKMHADIIVYEENIGFLEIGQKVDITIGKDRTLFGTIYSIAQAYEGDQKGVKVHIQLTNPPIGLVEGTYIKATIHAQSKMYYAVNDDAIVTMDNQDYIFIKDTHQKEATVYNLFPVKTLLKEDGYTAISLQKEASDSIMEYVSIGAYYMLSELQKGELDEH